MIHSQSDPIFCYHRGYSKIAPENTLSSFNLAVKNGAKMIEFDVQMTKDHELVVIHDFTISRTSNGKGRTSDQNYIDLLKLSFGSWFSKDFIEEKIPTLEQVFVNFGRKTLFDIELKIKLNSSKQTLFIKKILDLIYKYDLVNYIFISSFNWKILELLRKSDERVSIGILNDNLLKRKSALDLSIKNDFQFLVYDHKIVSKKIIDEIHNNKRKIFIYTINSSKLIDKFIGLEVDGIITDGK